LKNNITRLEARKTLSINENIHLKNDQNNFCNWQKLDYLVNDSIYICRLNFYFTKNNYLHGYENRCFISFADDNLYSQIYKVYYTPAEFKSVLEDFNVLKKIISKVFPDSIKTTLTTKSGVEAIGEHFYFHSEKDRLEAWKINDGKFAKYISIDIKYYCEFKDFKLRFKDLENGEIEKYVLEIKYNDLRYVKFDSRGAIIHDRWD
jgi:hypothetical protein